MPLTDNRIREHFLLDDPVRHQRDKSKTRGKRKECVTHDDCELGKEQINDHMLCQNFLKISKIYQYHSISDLLKIKTYISDTTITTDNYTIIFQINSLAISRTFKIEFSKKKSEMTIVKFQSEFCDR